MVLPVFGVGCGGNANPEVPEGVIVTGRILQSGEPLKMDRPEVALGRVEVQFHPVNDTNDTGMEATELDTEGNFQLLGPGKGIAPGLYKIAIFHDQTGYGKDALEGEFSQEETPIEVTIPEDEVGGSHDLGDIELENYAS
ncbi:hypothetical protein [Thalassoroseus pseudoceratinae]|uniref:hypothetical protein n=1 Tax=Thalassoroseus pseudoceratinae TaxID=2713176 RepID=UPI0014201D75|nr:hypothetical protein [Thalassoroseus pseudoceratinae]